MKRRRKRETEESGRKGVRGNLCHERCLCESEKVLSRTEEGRKDSSRKSRSTKPGEEDRCVWGGEGGGVTCVMKGV